MRIWRRFRRTLDQMRIRIGVADRIIHQAQVFAGTARSQT
jgi:hypothetical protein